MTEYVPRPNGQVLNPNQDMKSRVLSFKEEGLKEILSVVPRLAGKQASNCYSEVTWCQTVPDLPSTDSQLVLGCPNLQLKTVPLRSLP